VRRNESIAVTETIPTPESTPTITSAEVAPAGAVVPKARQSSVTFLWLCMAVLVAAICYGAVFIAHQYDNQQQILKSFSSQIEQQKQTIALQQQTIVEDLQKELADQQETVQAGMNDLAERIDSTAARVLALSSVSRDDWKLAEAQYLLRLAEQRILLERDSQNAIALALSADDILRDLNQADLVGVRKLLAEEIAVLKMAGFVDREGIYVRLAALSNQIDAIPFIEPLGTSPDDEVEDESPVENQTWSDKAKGLFYRVLHKLGSYVRVRDHGKNINAVLPPSEQKYLQQNLRLMLEQAQVALLRNESQIYTESLIKAQNWVNQYYTLNTEAEAVLTELKSLQEENVAPELTSFTNSSAALADYIARQEKMAATRRGNR